MQYSTNGSTWTNYSNAITISDNQAIYARLFDGTNAGGYATGNIVNIDRLVPNSFTPTATSTTNSITLSGSTTDQAKTATNGSSGIKEYYFSKDNGSTWQTNSNKLQTTYTYAGLAQNTVFTLKMKAVDNAGNEIITNVITKNTESVAGLDSSNVTFSYTPSTWTKSTVSVGITTTVTGYTLQYSTNGSTWANYSNTITISDNQAVYARLFDGTNAGGYATGNVANIDRLIPNRFTPTATSTSNSVTLIGSTTDQVKTATNGSSGIKEYYFSKDNGSTWQTNSNKLQTTYTYTGLAQNTVFTLKMKAVDNAGNEIITNAITKNTGSVAGLDSSNVTFSYTPSTWTKSTVSVGITTTVTGYTLQYSTNASTWTNYASGITISDNQAIYARLFDGTNAGGYATGNIANIDRLTPNNFTPTATSTTNSITLSGSTTDQARTATNGSSGIKEYQFSKDNGSTWQTNSNKLQTTYTYVGLAQNTVFTLKMKAVDNAGNEVITAAITKNTGSVTDLTGSNVTFTYSPSGWTNGNVVVGISTSITGYTLQYSTNGTTWTNYSSGVTITQNGAIYARLFDGTNAGGYATGNVTKIDKTTPTITTPAISGVGINSINVSTTINDGISGLGKLVCYYKKTTESSYLNQTITYQTMNGTATGAIGNQNKIISLTGLTSGTTYQIYVMGYDVAGNPITSATVTANTLVAIAKIGTAEYASLAEAVKAAGTSTITMVNNTTEKITFPAGKTITLGLNGKTITGGMKNSGNLIITGSGTITSSTEETMINYGDLKIQGGNIIKYSDGSGGIQRAVINEGTCTMTAGVIRSENAAWTFENKGTFDFKGGEINLNVKCTSTALYNSAGKLNMTGGAVISKGFGLVTVGGIVTTKGGSITATGDYPALHVKDQGKAETNSTTIKGSVANHTSSGKQCIIRSREANYGISGIDGKVIATTNVGPGQSQENVTMYNAGTSTVLFPTWTDYNGQDDLRWYNVIGTNVHTVTIYKSNHKNESGLYSVDIYTSLDGGSASQFIGGVLLTF